MQTLLAAIGSTIVVTQLTIDQPAKAVNGSIVQYTIAFD